MYVRKAVPKYLFTLIYSPNKHAPQEVCEKSVDDQILALRFDSDWFVTPKMLKDFDYHMLFNDSDPDYDYDGSIDDPSDASDGKFVYAMDLELIS